MAVVRRMFYKVGVEARSLCAVRAQLSEDGVPSPTGKVQWDIQSIRKLLRRDLYRPHTYAEMGRPALLSTSPILGRDLLILLSADC
jgi:Recombinase